ncbi:IS5 family transposase [Streptomyces sp. NPDC050392]|uniref:IS5 family transposase n=1 Tax=Streptomyces sp. NPDC050392 TaxID=3155782 RepID=UPI00342227C8
MGRGDLSDEEWARLQPHLPMHRGRGGRWQCHRRVINGILFRQRTGLPWRDLPSRFGKWKAVHDRHRRWSAGGTWERILRAVQTDPDAEGRIDWSMVSVDSTTCRAHQYAAGATTRATPEPPPVPRRSHHPCHAGATTRAPKVPGQRGQPARHRSDEALGRSRGGLLQARFISLGRVGSTHSGSSSRPASGETHRR